MGDGVPVVVSMISRSSMISRRVCEDSRRGSSDRDDPGGKRNACAAVYSSEHENLSLVAGE